MRKKSKFRNVSVCSGKLAYLQRDLIHSIRDGHIRSMYLILGVPTKQHRMLPTTVCEFFTVSLHLLIIPSQWTAQNTQKAKRSQFESYFEK